MVGLIAIAVLLLIMNWFFHRVYWSEWIGRFHRQRRELIERASRRGFFSAQVLGPGAARADQRLPRGLRDRAVPAVARAERRHGDRARGRRARARAHAAASRSLTFALQRKLPYKKMLIVTGVLIAFVLVVMVGQTARTMQGTGWLPITPAPVDVPYWAGLWFGVFPTWETIGAQVGAFVFVIGSYFLAQEVKVKRPQRRRAPGGASGKPEARRARALGRLERRPRREPAC